MPGLLQRLFAVRSVDSIMNDLNKSPPLNRVLTARSLTAIGLGSTIGTGIFVLTGTVAAEHAGPALTLALLLAAIGSGFAGICYAEFAAMIPVSGSAYTYSYVTLGEFIAWMIGWNLSLEYMISASAVAVSWSGYVMNVLEHWGITMPEQLVNAPFAKGESGHLEATGALVNLPAVLIIVLLGWVCYVGVKQSATANNYMVALKIGIIILFIVAGVSFVDTANWTPYLPPNTGTKGEYGWSGVLQGAGIIFFSYVGFDAASTTAREARNPQRDVPLGIIGALVISASLYVAMAAVMTGMVPYTQLNVDEPVAIAIDAHPELGWVGWIVKLGAIAGMTSVILMSLLGQPRILLSMADDGLLPKAMSKVHPTHRTPHVATAWTTVIAALFAGLLPLDVLGELISIGILLAFTAVCAGVLVLRITQPDTPRPFRVPAVWFTGVAGVIVCLAMTLFLPPDTWIRLGVWSVIGFALYFGYGYKHSRLRNNG